MVSGPARANRAVTNPPRLLNGETGEEPKRRPCCLVVFTGAYDDVRDRSAFSSLIKSWIDLSMLRV